MLYLWFTLFPGQVLPDALKYFSAEQVDQGRKYSRAQQLLFISSFLVQTIFLLWMVFGGRAAALSRWCQKLSGGNYLGSILLFFLALWILLRFINLPFTLYGSYFLQHHWGFSTQNMGAWWIDYLKSAGLDLILSAIGVVLLFWSMNRWSSTWWLACAAFISVWMIVQSFLWPVVVSPLFNRFVPVDNPEISAIVHELSQKAQIPVEQVLVMDASRRTTKANAYFTGLGHTKRIVLYDTLLNNYPTDAVKAAVAHEMAHWRQGHIIKGLTLSIIGSFVIWGLLFILLRLTLPTPMPYPPHTWAIILLFFLLISFASSPLQNSFSRNMEEEADRVAVKLTGDAPAAIRLQIVLSTKNLSDLSPPTFIQWFSYSHPPALTRINLIQQYSKP